MQIALYLASPDLFVALSTWLDGDSTDKACRIESSVVRYFMRMAGRATPFGLLAGISTGTVSDRTSLTVPASTENLHHIRLDAEYVLELTNHLLENEAISEKVRYQTAASSFEICGRLRYYEPYMASKSLRFRLVDVQRSSFLHEALSFARRNDGVVKADIADHLVSCFPYVTSAQAIQFVEALISAKLLWEMWSPPVTGTDPAFALIEKLISIYAGDPMVFDLCEVLDNVNALKRQSSEAQLNGYQAVDTFLSSVFQVHDSTRKLRIDLHKPGEKVSLSTSVIEAMQGGVKLLARIAPSKDQNALATFIRKFEQRYQCSEVPLLQALDEESGIGFDVELDDMTSDAPVLTASIPFVSPHPESSSWDMRTEWLFKKLCASLHSNDTELILSNDDIERLCIASPTQFPSGMSLLASIAAASVEAVDRGEYQIYLRKVVGPNSAKLLARFCHGDSDLLTSVNSALRQEEALDPDAIHAEIVHLPHYHAANVISRPLMREYEIPLFSRSGAPSTNQIPLNDLLVSVVDGTVLLRSARHGRRVVPHLTCAHAFRKSNLGIYRFLATLEEQGTWSELNFSWGLLSSAPYLPRVVSGRFILSLAQWKLQGSVLRQISNLSWAAAFRKLQDLRMQMQLPRFVMLTDGDNALPVDFENVLSLRSLLQTGKKLTTVTLTEQFPPPDKFIANGEEGSYHHELVVPFIRTSSAKGAAVLTVEKASTTISSASMSYPGRDWLFIKVYCGISASERLLSDVVSRLVTRLQAEGFIEQWFFVRHRDPDFHIRLRFRGQPHRLWQSAEPIVFEYLADAGELVRSFSIETYCREIDRYGGEQALDIAEHIFEADSRAALAIIMAEGVDINSRWKLVLIGMDTFLNDLRFSLSQKKKVVDACRDSMASVLQVDHHLRPHLDYRYRRLKPETERLLNIHSLSELQAGNAIQERSQKISTFVEQLQHLERERLLSKPLTVIAESYLHMWANRVFRSAANAQEFMLYDFLSRFYRSQLARDRAF